MIPSNGDPDELTAAVAKLAARLRESQKKSGVLRGQLLEMEEQAAGRRDPLKDMALDLIDVLEARVAAQDEEIKRLQKRLLDAAERVAAQSELLAQAAERKPHGKQLMDEDS